MRVLSARPARSPFAACAHAPITAVVRAHPQGRRRDGVCGIRAKTPSLLASDGHLQAAAIVAHEPRGSLLGLASRQGASHDRGKLLGFGLFLFLLLAPVAFLDLLFPNALHLVGEPSVGFLLLFLFLAAEDVDLLLDPLLGREKPVLLLPVPVLLTPRGSSLSPGRTLHRALRAVSSHQGRPGHVRGLHRGPSALLLRHHRRRNRRVGRIDGDGRGVLPPRALLENQGIGCRAVPGLALAILGRNHPRRLAQKEQRDGKASCPGSPDISINATHTPHHPSYSRPILA